MRTGTITHPNTRTRTRTQKKQYKTFEFKLDCNHFLKFMVGAHIRFYSEKVVTNEMPVEAVHSIPCHFSSLAKNLAHHVLRWPR